LKKKLKYKNELIRSMTMLSKNKKTIFLGQSVMYSGNAIFNTLINVPNKKKIEFPVAEEMQMGVSIGLAMNGYIPITCYPRFDFLILACNQMINHLDKMRAMSQKQFKLKVIIRTSVGSKKPLDGGIQHTQNYTDMFKRVLTEIEVIYLNKPTDIFKTFKRCINPKIKKSFLIVENGDFYNAK
jgi:pyruvate/2-oxoglutarate/acetoin dehydrogenase E1 component